MNIIPMLLIWAFVICWILLSYFAVSTNLKTFKKYEAINRQQIDPKYIPIARTDYLQWRKNWILVGSCTLFPIKVLSLASFISGLFSLVIIMSISGGIFKKMLAKLMFFYANTYGKLMNSFVVDIKDEFEDYRIDTPILIANHNCWFDIFYLTMRFSPISFVAKYDIKHWPVFGLIAQSIDCIFIKRQMQDSRQSTTDQIHKRIQNFKDKGKDAFPLAIFPQGTDSSDRYFIKFKNGAFLNKTDITALCLHYQCQKFDMGQDEIKQAEHIALILSQRPKLTVKKIIFSAKEGETVDEYRLRCQREMANVLGHKISQMGQRDRIQLAQIRKQAQMKQQ